MPKKKILVAYTNIAASKGYVETVSRCIKEATGRDVLILPPGIVKMEELSVVERDDADN